MQKSNLVSLIIVALSLLSITVPVQAETRYADAEFENAIEPTSISAVLFSNGTSYQASNVQVSMSEHGKTIAAIPFDSNLANQARFYAYAIAQTADGAYHYSNVVPASPQFDVTSGFAQPQCAPKEVPMSMQSQMSLVANLLKVRDKRRSNMRSQTRKLLSGEFLLKMQKYESGFGLQYGSSLSADMPAAVIVDRLDRILHTLRKVSAKK